MYIYVVLPIVGICVMIGGLGWPLCNNLISNLAPYGSQGKILGMSQSIQSLAMALAPIAGGMISQGSIRLPFLMGAISGFLALTVYYFSLKEQQS
jgi:MFS family permease